MKQLITAFALSLAALSTPALASTAKEAPEAAKAEAKPRSAQQTKMATCNAEARDKTGDERKAFMKECLSAKPTQASTQQNKMKTCNKEATGKSGDERKAFMKECLSKKA